MVELLLWFIYSLIPALITLAAGLSVKTMAALYFVAVAVALIIWGIREHARARKPEEV